MTYFSTLQLLATAAAAWVLWRRRQAQSRFGQSAAVWVWKLVAVGFVFLACDELFMIHEHLDWGMHRVLGWKPTGWTDRLDDLIVAAYGALGAGVLWRAREELRHFSAALPASLASALLLAVSIIFDTVTNRRDVILWLVADPEKAQHIRLLLSVLEDVAKTLGEGVAAAVIYHCLWIAARLP